MNKTVQDKLVLAFFALIVAGPILYYMVKSTNDPTDPSFRIDSNGVPSIQMVDHDNDPEMLLAMAQARKSVDQFIDSLVNQTAGQEEFSVKVCILEFGEANGEYVWLLPPVQYEDGLFSGPIGNIPSRQSGYEYGDKFVIAKDEIADWKYVEDGILQGGFTFRLMRSRLSEDEQRQLDNFTGFQVE